MPRPARRPTYRRKYEEYLHAVETVLRLIDGILEDTSPLLGLPEHPERQIQRLRDTKVSLSILAHFLRKGSEGKEIGGSGD